MITIAPKGRGWSVTIVEFKSIEPDYHLVERNPEVRDAYWRSLRKRVAAGSRIK